MPPARKTKKTTTRAAPKTRKRPRPGSEDAKMKKKKKSTTTSKRPKIAEKKSTKIKKSGIVIKSNDIENDDLRLLVSYLCGGLASFVIDTKTGKAISKTKLFAKFKDILKSDKRLAGLKKQDISGFIQIKVKSKRNKFTTIDKHLAKTSSQKASKLLAKSKAVAFAEGLSVTETRKLLLAKHKKIHAAVFIDAEGNLRTSKEDIFMAYRYIKMRQDRNKANMAVHVYAPLVGIGALAATGGIGAGIYALRKYFADKQKTESKKEPEEIEMQQIGKSVSKQQGTNKIPLPEGSIMNGNFT